MKEILMNGKNENKQEIIKNISSLLSNSLEDEKRIYDLYSISNIPDIVNTLYLSGLNINAIQDKLKFFSSCEDNKPTETRNFRDLNMFIQKILYPVVTYNYLEENKKDKSIKEINLIRDDKEANSPIFLGKGLEHNLIVNLSIVINDNPDILPNETKEKVKTWINNMRKKATLLLSKEESKEYLEGKLFLEKVYLELLLEDKIRLE